MLCNATEAIRRRQIPLALASFGRAGAARLSLVERDNPQALKKNLHCCRALPMGGKYDAEVTGATQAVRLASNLCRVGFIRAFIQGNDA